MNYRKLGGTGLPISELSFGSWLTFGKQIKSTTAKDLMALAYSNGVNFFDNAEIYARGESEKVMGRLLKDFKWSRDSYCVSSKVFFGIKGPIDSAPTAHGLHRKHIFEACHQALQRLKLDYLDLYFCHRPDKSTPIEETVWAMNLLIQQGKVLYWGTSEWSAQEIMEAHYFARANHLIGPAMEQPQYNMLHRQKFEVEFDQLYKNFGLGTTIWSPLASGLLTGKYNNKKPKNTRLQIKGLEWLKEGLLTKQKLKIVGKLGELAADLKMSMPQLALAWCLKNPNVSTVILGASKVSQLRENLKTPEHLEKLDDKVMERIEKILKNAPDRPNW